MKKGHAHLLSGSSISAPQPAPISGAFSATGIGVDDEVDVAVHNCDRRVAHRAAAHRAGSGL